MGVPTTLQAWTLDAIEQLLRSGLSEGLTFDWKLSLPARTDSSGQERLTKVCASFANTEGGFIVFGVSDNREHAANDRIVGMDVSIDIMEQLRPFLARTTPAIDGARGLPMPRLANGKLVHVVEVPLSAKRPHALGEAERGFRFPRRTTSGTTEWYNYDEIRDAFLKVTMRAEKGDRLIAELRELRTLIRRVECINEPRESSGLGPSALEVQVPPNLSLDAIDRLVDAGAATGAHSSALAQLARLRHGVAMINDHLGVMRTRLATIGPLPAEPDFVRHKQSEYHLRKEQRTEIIVARAALVREFAPLLKQAAHSSSNAAGAVDSGVRDALVAAGL